MTRPAGHDPEPEPHLDPRDLDPVELDEDEQELVALEVQQLLPALRDQRRERFEELLDAAEDGTVPPELVAQLESVVALALQTARARQLYRAEGEKILTGLYRRTPGGRRLTKHLGDVNQALATLVGAELTNATVRMRTLGHFTVTLETATASMRLAVRPDGVEVDSVAVGDS